MSDRRDETNTLDQVLLVLRRRWRIIVLCAVLVGASAVGFSLLQSKAYTASASLLFRDPGFDQKLFGTSFFIPNNDPTREAATNIDLVSLPTVAARTANVLGLRAGLIKSEVSVRGVGQANVAKISATDPSPVRAAKIANVYAQQYILFRQQADRSKISAAQGLVQNKLASLSPSQRNSDGGQLQNRSDQLGILAALQTGNAELVQAANVPNSPSSPLTKRNGILGTLLGLMLGIGLAFGADRLDRRIRDASGLEAAYGVPILGTVPESPVYQRTGAGSLPPIEAEAFALLRARLRYFNVDRDVRSLLITSAIPGEGKTTVALNLAIAEALAGTTKIVLVEADLRRPVLSRRLGIPSGPGLAEILSRNATLESALREIPPPGHENGSNGFVSSLSVITAGAIPPNPAELIESRAMIDLLSALSERFDLVIIDCPPTAIVSDAIPLMRLVSGVVIVSRIGVTTRDVARHLHEQLIKLNAPTLGVVANAVPPTSRGYYGYGYGYYRNGYAADPSDLEQEVAEPERSATVDAS